MVGRRKSHVCRRRIRRMRDEGVFYVERARITHSFGSYWSLTSSRWRCGDPYVVARCCETINRLLYFPFPEIFMNPIICYNIFVYWFNRTTVRWKKSNASLLKRFRWSYNNDQYNYWPSISLQKNHRNIQYIWLNLKLCLIFLLTLIVPY